MNPKKELRARITPIDVLSAQITAHKQDFFENRDKLTAIREEFSQNTDNTHLKQLAEAMKALGMKLGHAQSDFSWLLVLTKYIPPSLIAEVWREKRENDAEEPPGDR